MAENQFICEKMTNHFDEILTGFGFVSSLSRQQFVNHAQVLEFTKNQEIFAEGKKNTFEYLLLSGISHRYTFTDLGEMVTTGLYVAPAVITPHFARTSQGKSMFSLQSLTEVVLAAIPVAELDRLRSSLAEFRDFGQRVIEQELVQSIQQEVTFRSFSAKERLLALRRRYPLLENLIPHHIIASYLGITHVSFSRLRKELALED